MSTSSSGAVTIREADKTDIPVISRLAHVVWPETYGTILSGAQLKYMLDLFYAHEALAEQFDNKHVFLLATLNAEIVGFASYAHASTTGTFKVHKLYVHPLVQGKGVGKQMLDHITERIKHSGATHLQLFVNRQNPAKQFYEKYGFHVVGEEDTAIGEGYFMTDYVMEKAVQ